MYNVSCLRIFCSLASKLKGPLSLTVMHRGRFDFSGPTTVAFQFAFRDAVANKSVSIGKAVVVCFDAHLVSYGRSFVWLSL